jgi:hypothetical protein
MDKNSPPKLKSRKMNKSIDYREIEEMVDQDEEIRKHKLEIEKLKRDQQKQLEQYLKREIDNEYALDNITQSAQEFAKQNIKRIKIREEENLRMHAAIKRKELEAREQKQKEQEIKDRETQMEKLEQERELMKNEYEKHEEYLKEITRKQMKTMETDMSTKQQIEKFRKKQQKEIEKRKSLFEQKVIILVLFILDGQYFRKN